MFDDDEEGFWATRFGMGPDDWETMRRQAADNATSAYDEATRALANGGAPLAKYLSSDNGGDKYRAGYEGQVTRLLAARAATPRPGAPPAVRDQPSPALGSVADRLFEIGAQMGGSLVHGIENERAMGRAVEDAVAHRVERGLGLGTPANPGPGQLVREWRTGEGPTTRDLPPDSDFSRQFVAAPAVQDHIRRAVGIWKNRPGGLDAQNGTFTGYPARFGPAEYLKDLNIDPGALLHGRMPIHPNTASHVIGSFRLDGHRNGDRLEWSAANGMGQHSFYEGHPADWVNDHIFGGHGVIPTVPNVARPNPNGTTRQTIRFITDLNGRPIP